MAGRAPQATFRVDRRPVGDPAARASAADAATAALRAGGSCQAWAALPAEIDAWLASAEPGERFVYCTGPVLAQGPAAERARALYAQKRVDFLQKRREDGCGFDYLLVKMRVDPSPRPSAEGEEADAAMENIFTHLKRCANFERRCPSDHELARLVGLSTRAQAAWRMAKLVEQGRIKRATVEGGPEAGWRVVTIVASGKSTLLPPSWRALKRSIAAEASE